MLLILTILIVIAAVAGGIIWIANVGKKAVGGE
jgi:hypothetical protein